MTAESRTITIGDGVHKGEAFGSRLFVLVAVHASQAARPLERQGQTMPAKTKTEHFLSQERLKEILDYDPNSGVFTWKVSRGAVVSVGDKAGSVRPTGHVAIVIDRKPYLAHRLAWFFTHGTWPNGDIEHVDGNYQNNAIANLRDQPVSKRHTRRNPTTKTRAYSSSKSGYRGVYSFAGKWRAQITINGKIISLGMFDTPEAANEALKAYRRDHLNIDQP